MKTNNQLANDLKAKRRKLLKYKNSVQTPGYLARREDTFNKLFGAGEQEVRSHLQSFLPVDTTIEEALEQGWCLREIRNHHDYDLSNEEDVKRYSCLSNWVFGPKGYDSEPIGSISEEFPFYNPDKGWNYKLSDILRMTLEQAKKWNRPFPLSKAHFYDALEWICSSDESGIMTSHQTTLIKCQFPYGYICVDGNVRGQNKIEWDMIYRNSTYYPGVYEKDSECYTKDTNVRANSPELFKVRSELYGKSEELDEELRKAQELRDLGLSFRQIAIELQLTEYRARSYFGGD